MNRRERRAAARQSGKSAAVARTPAAFFEAGLRLLKAGQFTEAGQCGQEALTLDAGHADSLHLMGLLCLAAKQDELAIDWFAQAISQNPNVADYFSNLATALVNRGRIDEAIRSLDRALTLESDHAEVWYRMGLLLERQNRKDEASLSFDQALKAEPRYLEAANAAALCHFNAGRYERAIACFEASLAIDPAQDGAFHFLGISQLRLRRFDEAHANCVRALALAPDNAEITGNVGLTLLKLGRNAEAIGFFDTALALDPRLALVHCLRASALAELRRFDEALADYDRAIAIDPQLADAHWNGALLRLLLGDFENGWAGRLWGRKCAAVGFVDRQFAQPLWRGETDIAGKTILLHSDEGLGDTIQFARYATLVAQLGAEVILEVQDVVHPLLSGIDGVALCLPKTGVILPDFDLQCPMSDLPLAFATRLDTIPAAPSYLSPPQARLREWRARLGAHDRLRVGLVWSGNPAHGNDHNRSIPFAAMTALLGVDACFISLQKDPRPADQAVLRERSKVVDPTSHLTDFAETAALIACLDLVITVDTSVAHLAGAMGRPTWILLPYTPDYRWLLDRDDSPWYPSVRLFRQGERRDYGEVLARVRDELQKLAAGFRG
jgi:tetratricopeptide (TPR) repeat protein